MKKCSGGRIAAEPSSFGRMTTHYRALLWKPNRWRSAVCLAGVFFALLAAPGRADFVLLQDGRALFNVRVVDTDTTQARPLRVIFKPQSFGYDYDRNSPFLLRGRSDVYWVADYVTTTTELGKSGAREWMQARRWNRYTAPPPPRVPVITPAPPTPVPTPAEEEVTPANVADPLLPIEKRIQRQLDIFIEEQTTLAEQIRLYLKVGGLDAARARQMRQELLQKQIRVLEKHYPADDDLVARAKEALENQRKVVEEKGRFNFED